MGRHEMRSVRAAGAQLDWVDLVHGEGVGARQGQTEPPAGGGGYLDECTTSELWTEARYRELSDMGLPQVWLHVAREIGYDRFMAMWRILDAALELRSDSDSMIEVQLRRYASFQRYQRNRFIESLVSMGLTPPQIQRKVREDLGEKLSLPHIRRLAKRRRVAA